MIREAMRGKDMVALGRVVLAKRERVIMLQPRGKGLMATTLRYPYEIRDTKEYFERHSRPEGRAGHAQAGRADPSEQVDRLRYVAFRGSLRGSRCRDALEKAAREKAAAKRLTRPSRRIDRAAANHDDPIARAAPRPPATTTP